MRQLTLISLYGQKPSALVDLIAECQKQVSDAVGTAFTRYDVREVHATIIGLERRIGSRLCNLNMWQQGQPEEMSIGAFLSALKKPELGKGLPVRIGGFDDRGYPFSSRNTTPYSRSFSIQGDKVVVMGWPISEELLAATGDEEKSLAHKVESYPKTLEEIRRDAQSHGILHAYHSLESKEVVDNDLYFRIGLIDPTMFTYKAGQETEARLRKYLSKNPIKLRITTDDIYVASYKDERLPLGSTKVWSLADDRVTGGLAERLYE